MFARMTKATLLASTTTVAVATLVSASAASSPASNASVSAIEALLGETAACEFNCQFSDCDDGEHELIEHSLGNDTDVSGSGDHGCRAPDSCGAHSCTLETDNDAVAALMPMLDSLSRLELIALARVSDRVSLNESRQAVQVTGCTEDIIVTMALPSDNHPSP